MRFYTFAYLKSRKTKEAKPSKRTKEKKLEKISLLTVLRTENISTVQMSRRILPFKAARFPENTQFASPKAFFRMSKKSSFGTPP